VESWNARFGGGAVADGEVEELHAAKALIAAAATAARRTGRIIRGMEVRGSSGIALP